MRELNAAIRGIPMPATMEALPVDERGWPVPWFIAWFDGKPDFRILDTKRLIVAVKRERCWICGGKLGRLKVSVIGPMCAISRTTAEPASHPGCARYAVMTCPFLTKPRMRRNEKDMRLEREPPPGVMIERNPGVSVLWASLKASEPFDDGRGKMLLEVGPPHYVEWYREGRRASRKECMDSIQSGLPFLRAEAEREGEEAVAALGVATLRAISLLPEGVG
jgi:hypothetical protein